MTDVAIHISGVTKRFGTKTVLNELHYSLRKGTVTGLLGKNGSGKTTLLKCALGLQSPQEGECFLLSEPARQLSAEAKARLAYVPQEISLYPWMKVRQVIAHCIMDKYIQIANTYLTRKLMVIIVFLSLFSLLPILVWFVPDSQSDMTDVAVPGLLMQTFFFFFLGAHVKQQLARPEARLIPNFRQPHLIVAGLLIAGPIIGICLLAYLSNQSVSGVVALAGFAYLSVFHLAAQPNRIAFYSVMICVIAASAPALRNLCVQLMQGQLPALAYSLLSMESVFAVMLFHHLATLTEEDPDYGHVLPMNLWDMRAPEMRRRNRAQLQRSPRVLLTMLRPISRRLDRLTQTPAHSRFQRVALLRLSGDWPMNVSSLIGLFSIMELTFLLVIGDQLNSAEHFSKALSWHVYLSSTLGSFRWLPLNQRWSRLGYESLRPTTRRQWVQENALAIAIDTLQIQGLWLVVQSGVLLCFLGSFWNSPAIPNALMFLLGANVLLFGVSAWTASLGSTVWTMVGLCIVVGFLQPAWFGISGSAMTFGYTIPAIAAGCGLTGFVWMAIAYRRWCRMDLN